ncbi:MAG: PEP-CTERM sorting domain-containing protein [Syntrophobacteraceae bacterium]
MRTTFILVVALLLWPCCKGFAVPLEAVNTPTVHGDNSILVASGPSNSGAPAATASAPVVSSSVPSSDPVIKGAGANNTVAKIPKFPVEMYVRQGTNSRFELFFLNVKYGYDLSDFQFYNAWCLRKGAPLPGQTIHVVRLYNSSDPNLPPEFRAMGWRRITYVINHRQGATKEDVQQAIWRLAKSPGPKNITPRAARLIEEANRKAKDYTPATGDLVPVLCLSTGEEQPLFIEYKVPPASPPQVKGAFFAAPLALVGGAGGAVGLPLIPAAILAAVPFGSSSPNRTPPTTVPEPSSLLLLAVAVGSLLLLNPKRFEVR